MNSMEYTTLETRVYNLLVKEMRNNGILDTREIAEALNLTPASIKGVLGSLTKKNLVSCDPGNEFQPGVVWPVHRFDGTVGFWADSMDLDYINEALIKE